MNYDTKEYEAILELKKRMKEQMDLNMYEDDHLFYRFLKARNFNIQQAEMMLKNHIEWRKAYDVETILEYKQPEVLEKYLPFVFIGYDKEGSTIRYMPSGTIDWIGIALSVKMEDMTKRVIFDVETDLQILKEQSKKMNKNVDKCVYIQNLENFSFTTATDKKVIQMMISLFQMHQNNFPETLKSVYIINASMYFSIIFSVLKKCLAASILDKIKIYWDDSFKADLLKEIDADTLPAFLGGNKKDPDENPLFETFVRKGGPIPETYFKHRSKRTLTSQPDVQKVTLSRAAFQEVKLDVKIPGSFLEWEFETKSRDIGFGLFYQQIIDEEEKNIQLVPLQRINTDEYAETGIYLCEKPGTYVIVFDNTYSWIRAKEIFYRIKVTVNAERETIV